MLTTNQIFELKVYCCQLLRLDSNPNCWVDDEEPFTKKKKKKKKKKRQRWEYEKTEMMATLLLHIYIIRL